MSQQGTSSVKDVVDTLEDLAESEDEVTVGDVTHTFGGRGFGPLMLLPALLVITPLGGIPIFPSLMALLIALVAIQLILQRDRIWLPKALENRAVTDEKVQNSADRLRPVARVIDRVTGERLTLLVREPAPSLAAAVIVLLCLTVPFSEVVPFAAILPMAAIAILALALTVKDGIWMLVGLICSAGALFGLYLWLA
jgi:hypothetical protein